MTEIYRCAHCGSLNRIPRSQGERAPICGKCKQRLDTTGAPQPVNDAELSRAIEASPVPVLVDFWAAWCGPCKMAAPILEQVAKARRGQLLVLKLDTDRSPAAAARHHVDALPTFVLFRGGREAARQSGLMPLPAFERWLAATEFRAGADTTRPG